MPTETPNTPAAGATPAANNAPAAQDTGATPDLTWEAWLEAQPEDQRTVIGSLFEKRMTGVTSALNKEREDRKSFEKQLRDMAKGAEAGSEAQRNLNDMADKLVVAERKADFYRDAAKPDVGIADAEAAWIIANAKPDDFFDKRGNLLVNVLKERHPSLFAQPKPVPKVNAGSGTKSNNAGAQSMNDFIRDAAGRRIS